jgi:hypothetical protein
MKVRVDKTGDDELPSEIDDLCLFSDERPDAFVVAHISDPVSRYGQGLGPREHPAHRDNVPARQNQVGFCLGSLSLPAKGQTENGQRQEASEALYTF